MPSDEEVLNVIEQWSGKRPGKMSQNLEKWWDQTAPGSSHRTLPFDPDGIEDLVRRLRQAFSSSPALESCDFGSSGNIKTVEELSEALLPAVAAADLEMAALDVAAPELVRKPARKPARYAAKKARKTAPGKRKAPVKSRKKPAAKKSARPPAKRTKAKKASKKASRK